MKILESSSVGRIGKKAIEKLLKTYNMPKPSFVEKTQSRFYRWDHCSKLPKGAQQYFSIFHSPSVSVYCWTDNKGDKRWAVSTFCMVNGMMQHIDARGWYSSEEEAIEYIFKVLIKWADSWALNENN